MTARTSVKARKRAALVAVIASGATFRRAISLNDPADFFELRLDALVHIMPEIERAIEQLRAPLIITARHPLEGGINHLSAAQRRHLLLRFLPRAAAIDVELRSVPEFNEVLEAARARHLKLIISVHEMDRSLVRRRFQKFLESARRHRANIFKIVTRTETTNDVTRLIEFFEANKKRIALSAMGAGRLGSKARITLARSGSVLNYVHLGTAHVAGQMSLAEMRQKLNAV